MLYSFEGLTSLDTSALQAAQLFFLAEHAAKADISSAKMSSTGILALGRATEHSCASAPGSHRITPYLLIEWFDFQSIAIDRGFN